MKEIIKTIIEKNINDSDKIKLINKLLDEDTSNNYWFNKFVKLSDTQYNKLKDKYWLKTLDAYINRLDWRIYIKWDKYKSHYLVIINWISKDNLWINKEKIDYYVCSFWRKHKLWIPCNC